MMNKTVMWIGGIVFAVIAGLAGILWDAQKERDAHQETCIEKLDQEKVDNRTMQMSIEMMHRLMDERKEQTDRVLDEIKELKKD